MKITIPELVIKENEGFSKNDIFKRKEFGDNLLHLIKNTDDNLVLALDSQWGEGKTTFIKMWRGHLLNQDDKIKTIYFDAFSNDYQKDPFLALISEIYDILPIEEQHHFKKGAKKAFKAFVVGGLKTAAKIGTAGFLDDSLIEDFKGNISDAISSQIDNIIEVKLHDSKENKMALSSFKDYLATLPDKINNGNPIVFIIDELDRCRPDFALELIEQIKHLFSVPKITFLLVTNRSQLEETIKLKYGAGIQASLYLQKFVHVWLKLPRRFISKSYYSDDGSEYFNMLINKMISEENENTRINTSIIELLEELIKFNKISFREIERLVSYFALISNIIKKEYDEYHQYIIAIIIYLNVLKPKVIKHILDDNYDLKEII